MNYDLSIIIPARSEMFLARTVEDILKNKRGNTEIIIGLDGEWADPVIKDHRDVSIYHTSEPIGQRAITNQCVALSRSKYVMKVDAHCAFDEGFDVKMIDMMCDDWTMVPVMRNLWVFDWECSECGNRLYQGPTPTKCDRCGSTAAFKRVEVWKAKEHPQSTSFCFDATPHFQYFKEYTRRPQPVGVDKLTETMSLQGSCFMATREKYHELNLCDETFGSWGSQGIEVACKTWLSGGMVIVNHNTWYAHCFRTKGDFTFPYPNPGRKIQRAKEMVRDVFFNNKWPQAVHPLSWLVQKFWPVPGWTQADLQNLICQESTANNLSGK